MPFGPVDPNLDLVALEERVQERWRATDLQQKVQDARAGGEPWIFYEGPPTANGRPGLHHVWARAFKDLYPRFQTMRGRSVPRKGGWDCHGLPVELEVEKELGLHTKHEIEAYGVAEFNQRCRESVRRYVEDWSALTARSGVWIDTADAYWTLSDDYIESVWWLVRQLWDRGLLYEGHRVVALLRALRHRPLLPRGPAQGYQDVVDPSVYVRFPLVDDGSPTDGADLLVWTTTPWTLVSNVAAAVGPDIAYVRVADPDGGRDLVLAAAAAERRYPDAEPVGRWTGAELVGRRYRAALRRASTCRPRPTACRVVAADFVTTDDGSGIVHLAPAFGEEDAAVGRAEGLPVLNPVDAEATFDDTVPGYTGRFVKDADADLIDDARPAGPARRPGALRAQLPALLALRHAAHLLGQDLVVRPHLRAPRRAAPGERDDRVAPRAPQARSLRQVARGQHRLGPVPGPLLGHAAAHLAVRRGATTPASAPSPSCPSWPGATSPASTCTGPPSTR